MLKLTVGTFLMATQHLHLEYVFIKQLYNVNLLIKYSLGTKNPATLRGVFHH